MSAASALSPEQRRRDLSRMRDETFDAVVIGGGVTGAGAVLDAASRGLRVAMIEQRDYAAGTSSRSSKLFHGGLRYLEHLEFGLVREALAERNLMVTKIAPHLAHPVSFVYPLLHPIWERLYVGAGVMLYDLMSRGAPLPRPRHLSRSELERLSPALDPARVRGGIQYYDVMVDDARHTMTLVRTAVAHGAAVANSTRATGLVVEGGRITGVEAKDLESGSLLELRTRAVINATGVWSADLQTMSGNRKLGVLASKGVHLVVPADRIRSDTGLILRTEKSVMFVIPFGRHWIVGTTDTPWSLRRAHPAASRTDIEYVLRWVNTVLANPLGPEDVVGVYAGLRPLLAGESDETSRLSREHAVVDSGNGMVSVAGGKYTTYRVMARDAVDAVVRSYLSDAPRSSTHDIPLVGATGPQPDDPRLATRYGSMASEVLELIQRDPRLGEAVVPDAGYLRAEIVYAATHEGALHLDDFLTRRTRLSIETRDRGASAAPLVADLVTPILGWSRDERERELTHYLARVEAELDSQSQPDDHTADAARMGAPDVRTGISE